MVPIAGINVQFARHPRLGPLKDLRLACFTTALFAVLLCLETSARKPIGTKPTEPHSPRHGNDFRFARVNELPSLSTDLI